MSLSNLVYSPLKEEEKQLAGWSKATIDYVIANKSKVHTSIRGIAKSLNKIMQKTDVEDAYMDILNYLYQSDDYNISKAYERSNNVGVIVSLEGYVHSCIKFCVIRYVTNSFNSEKVIVRDSIKDDDGKELSLFDTIPDAKSDGFTEFGYQLDTICKAYESQRYQFGPDIFQIWFIRLQTMINNKNDSYKDILAILGISKKDISIIEKEANVDGAMISIAKAITLIGIEEAVEIIRNYTYAADKIQRVIELF
ncbi:MAG: hypothetical protein J6A59_17040 [Lachnospiraceae bacterium]|nr:hypothetical protein [Lachnospiraceae bacterium]